MGAVFELESVSSRSIPLDVCIQLFHSLDLPFVPQTVEVIRSWAWEPVWMGSAPVRSDFIESHISQGHIVFIYGQIHDVDAGLYIEPMDDRMIATGLWFGVELRPFFDAPAPSLPLQRFYARADQALSLFLPYGLAYTAMGVEIYLDRRPSIQETMAHSIVEHWFIP